MAGCLLEEQPMESRTDDGEDLTDKAVLAACYIPADTVNPSKTAQCFDGPTEYTSASTRYES